MKLPWWYRPDPEPSDETLGEPDDDLVLVTTRRDDLGHPIEQVWVAPELAWQYDEAEWHQRDNSGMW